MATSLIGINKINFLQPNLNHLLNFVRGRKPNRPRMRYPNWYIRKEKSEFQENITNENRQFLKEVIQDKYGPKSIVCGVETYQQPSPLLKEPMEKGEWIPGLRRTGLIARKIGVYPMWTKDGKKMLTTLLQVLDNHVVKYIPPDEYQSPRTIAPSRYVKGRYGSLIIGAESTDPQKLTKEYCGLFAESGVMPKKILTRYLIDPRAAIQPGTPLYASHFNIGDWVDVRGTTKYHGFQGVMKRWGFKGMPASHGVTKTHRRPGNIGGGGAIARVWPGTKLPGHMGYDKKTILGLQVLRINTKYNVIWVQGPAVPGDANSIVYIRDTLIPNKKFVNKPKNFPTFYLDDQETPLPEEMYIEKMHCFSDPTIIFKEEVKDPSKSSKKRK